MMSDQPRDAWERRRQGVALLAKLLFLARPLADALLANAAFLLAYGMRYIQGIGGEVSERYFVTLDAYLGIQLAWTAVLLLANGVGGLYRGGRTRSFLDDAGVILAAASIGMMLLLAMVFLFQGQAYSRWLFFLTWALSTFFLLVARGIAAALRALLRRRGWGVQRALVVGCGDMGRMVMHVLSTEPGLGYQLVGYLFEDSDAEGTATLGRFAALGSWQEMVPKAREQRIDEVFIAVSPNYRHLIPRIVAQCEEVGLPFKIVPDLYEMSLSRVNINDLRGIPVIGVKAVSIQGFNLFLKRAFDLAVGSMLVVFLAPLWALLALLIKLNSPGPVLFRQERVGKGGKPFVAYKFRSMRHGAEREQAELAVYNEAAWPLFKMRDDPRITRIGHWLRRTSLDELPQLINVIRGEMSLVGPRPPLPSEVEKYEPWHRKRLEAAPGITGLWQVSGRSELPFDEMVLLDLYYIENWSLALDFKLLLRTVPAVLSGKGAY